MRNLKNAGSAIRSPLRERPLRNPGQSLDERVNDLVLEELAPLVMLPMFIGIMTALEWWRRYHPAPAQPWAFTVVLVVVVWVCWRKMLKLRVEMRALKQGRDGEKAVGQELEALRRKACHVFHDLPGARGNIDHAVVAVSGVYTIETKTLSKPVGRDARVRYDGNSILVDRVDRGSEFLAQARAERDQFRRLLKDMTGMDVPVRPVIVFPGWYIDTVGRWRSSDVWVLNPGMLPGFLQNEEPVLRPHEVALIHTSLAAYVRQ